MDVDKQDKQDHILDHQLDLKFGLVFIYIHTLSLYTLQVYLGPWTRPETFICSAAAQKAELKIVWGCLGGEDLEWGRGKCASLYTGSSV